MVLKFVSRLPRSAGETWEREKSLDRLSEVSRPLLEIRRLSGKNCLQAGESYELGLRLFGIIPWGKHRVDIVDISDEAYRFETSERGTGIKSWRHVRRISPISHTSCICSDEIRIQAGLTTPLVWAFAKLLYRQRHRRMAVSQ